jgi:hypothetical protein
MHPSVVENLHRARRGETAAPTASGQPHQHRFRDVILLVAEPNDTRLLLEKRILYQA